MADTDAPREAPLSVRMTPTLKKRADRAAKRNKMPRNAFIVNAVIMACEKDEMRAQAARRQVQPRPKGKR